MLSGCRCRRSSCVGRPVRRVVERRRLPSWNFLTSPWPLWSRRCSSYSPLASEKYAIDLPSGDQAGSRSAAPGELVRLRTSPFLAGTVRISPRASKTARTPVGDRPAFCSCLPTLTNCGRSRRQVGVDANVHALARFGLQIEQVDGAELLVDDAVGAGRSGLEVEPELDTTWRTLFFEMSKQNSVVGPLRSERK